MKPVEDDFLARVLPVFISEANEQGAAFEQLLLQLEGAPDDAEGLGALFRCVHTIKGSAGIFGLDAVVAFAHHVETVLDHLREGRLALTPDLSTLLLQSNDQIRALIARSQAGPDPGGGHEDAEQRRRLVAKLRRASGDDAEAGPEQSDRPIPTHATPSADLQRWQLSVAFGPDTFRAGTDPRAILQYLQEMGTLEGMACRVAAVPDLAQIHPETCHLALEFVLVTAATRADIEGAFEFVRDDCELCLSTAPPRQVQGIPAPGPTPTPAPRPLPARPPVAAPADEARFIRVHADRLDVLINLLGELVTVGAGAALNARHVQQRELGESILQMTTLIEEIRNGTLQLRMVPIGETFARFRRVVRDTASELGKSVALDIQGSQTELDKAVVERIADPLMHLVRNALDHGLETPGERVAAGKPPEGRLTLAARHESGHIVIDIVDDGRGIQREKILQRAWDRGLLERGNRPPDADILALIFEPGFSTAEKVTNLSGRGVGMDVVRRNIQDLRGSVSLHSEAGQGSCIEIRLPLTLAIIDGFLVAVGPSKFIFPLTAVVEVIESRPSAGALDPQGRGMVELRGLALPVVSLRALYELDSPEPERGSVVVLQAAGNRFGVIVDRLLGQHQTVIKPLGRLLGGLRGMSGSSILGNGEVALIFDAHALGQLAACRTAGRRMAAPRRHLLSAGPGHAPGADLPTPQPQGLAT